MKIFLRVSSKSKFQMNHFKATILGLMLKIIVSCHTFVTYLNNLPRIRLTEFSCKFQNKIFLKSTQFVTIQLVQRQCWVEL